MKNITLTYLVFLFSVFCYSQNNGNVGVNTSDPQQKLHIAGDTSVMRITSLDSLNNTANRNFSNAPLYVNEHGELTLEFDIYHNTDSDEFDGTSDSASIYQYGVEEVEQELFSREITVSRDSYLEIKFSISFQVFLNDRKHHITDGLARAVRNFVLLNNDFSRKYGMTSKAYTNKGTDGVNAMYYNNASTFIYLTEGTHTIHFYGSVDTDASDVSTYVEYGIDEDMLLLRIY